MFSKPPKHRVISQQRKSNSRYATSNYTYRRKAHFVTPPEVAFFHTLTSAVNTQDYYIIPQVHLSHLFDHEIKGQCYQGAFSKINQKSVDYVICTRKYLNPICAIELDDSSHNRADRMARDKFVNDLFQSVNLPLIRVNIKQKQDIIALKHQLSQIQIPTNFKF